MEPTSTIIKHIKTFGMAAFWRWIRQIQSNSLSKAEGQTKINQVLLCCWITVSVLVQQGNSNGAEQEGWIRLSDISQ